MSRDLWIAPVAIASLAIGWTIVQAGWRRTFRGVARGGDALAGRLGCRGCGECDRTCETRTQDDVEDAPRRSR